MNYSDKTFVNDEKKFLEKLLPLSLPASELAKLDKHGWQDWEEDEALGTLLRGQLVSILQRFINEEITAQDLNYWADSIDMRDTLNVEKGYNDVMRHIIGQIAAFHTGTAPSLPLLTSKQAVAFLSQLQSTPYNTDED